MKKNIIIAILAIFSIISTSSVVSMSKKASYWMQRTIAAEAVIQRVEEDNEDYILDVLSESDVWYEWYEVFCPGI